MQNIIDEKRIFDNIADNNLKTELNFDFYLKFYNLSGINYTNNSESLLEVGCGEGTHCFNFVKLGYNVVGIDVSKKAIDKAKKKIKFKDKLSFYCIDVNKFDAKNDSFDYVVFWNTLHHFYYVGIRQIIDKLARAIKIGGYLIILEPNNLCVYNNIIYSLAHLARIYNVSKFKDSYTLNEHSLNPYKLIEMFKDKFKLININFLPYVSRMADISLKKTFIRRISEKIIFYFPKQFKYDSFSLIFKKI